MTEKLSIKYKTIHVWLNRNFFKPKTCDKCKKNKKLDWALIAPKYSRIRNDYLALCRSCHFKMDKINYKSTLILCSNNCGKVIEVKPYKASHAKNHYCSRECYWLNKQTLCLGTNNSNYKHGKYIYLFK